MKKYLIAIAFLFVAGSQVQAASGSLIPGSEADFFSQTQSTGASIFTGAGVVDQICVSTGNGGAFAVAYDTGSTLRFVQTDLAGSSLAITNAMIFSSGTIITTNGASVNANSNCFGGAFGKGIRVQNGLVIFQSGAGAGESNRTNVYWRRD